MSSDLSEDRRQQFRLVLAVPMHGRVGSTPVLVHDISTSGLRIVHDTPVARVGQPLLLVIERERERIELHCEVRRTQIRASPGAESRKLFESGVCVVPAETLSLTSLGELLYIEGRKACEIPPVTGD